MQEKGVNRLVPGPDDIVDALKLANQAPRVSASNGPVVDRDLNSVFGHMKTTNKIPFQSHQIHSRTFLAISPDFATV
ncbi:hypothetical protein TNCV_4358181 [Trichonephila clavipes]|nr:hypothetical protein TNCV_4358181 [Trichonephila clavipes]